MKNEDRSEEMLGKIEALATVLTTVIDAALKELDSYQVFRMLLDCTDQVAEIAVQDRPTTLPDEDNPLMSQSNFLIVVTLAEIQRKKIEEMEKEEARKNAN